MLVANGSEFLEEVEWRNVEAAFALHRLDDNGGDACGLHVIQEDLTQTLQSFSGVDTVGLLRERRMIDLGRERAEALLVG
jgi:hypothetical protein